MLEILIVLIIIAVILYKIYKKEKWHGYQKTSKIINSKIIGNCNAFAINTSNPIFLLSEINLGVDRKTNIGNWNNTDSNTNSMDNYDDHIVCSPFY